MENMETTDAPIIPEPKIDKARPEIFGSFFLGTSEFALAVGNIQEVVNPPEKLSPMPLAPDYLLGIFNLREMIVPVVDLRKLLHLEDLASSKDLRKIAIVELEGALVGLLFDRTGEVFRNRVEDRSDFEYTGTTKRELNVISGAIKLDEGKRIVQLLNPAALISLESVPRPNSQKGRKLSGSGSRSHEGGRKQCISFVVGPSQCAFDIDCISEIIKVQKIQSSALATGVCLGMITLRGDLVPVVDFPRLLGYEAAKSDEALGDERRIVVMKLGDEKFGLLVNSVQNIVTYYADDLLPVPVLSKHKAQIFKGCLSRPGVGDVMVLAHDHVLSNSEVIEITHGHSKIYQSSSARGLETKKRGHRKTYITFKLDGLFAVGIEDIGEIIDFPKDLLHPPGLPEHVEGMLNLRGQVLPIVDARDLYAMKQGDSALHRKVMIFTRRSERFGLVVDSVENILTFSDEERLKLPDSLSKQSSTSLNSDIKEAVEISTEDGGKKALIILNLDSLADRVLGSNAA